jgi:hypothetical protein
LQRWKLLLLVAGLLVPVTFAGAQLVQVADAQGCPSQLLPTAGALKLRLFYEEPAQAVALRPDVLATYLASRFQRPVQITGIEQADEVGFRLAAAARPWSDEMLAFLAFRYTFPDVPTSHGLVNALGFATPGSACAYVSFVPQQPVACRLGQAAKPLQPGYAYMAHELGHLMGLGHVAMGLMGKGVFELCEGDLFTDAQRAQIAAWGR